MLFLRNQAHLQMWHYLLGQEFSIRGTRTCGVCGGWPGGTWRLARGYVSQVVRGRWSEGMWTLAMWYVEIGQEVR